MIPDEFVGVWQRVSIALGDGPAGEGATQVFWLQGHSAYADIRVPADGSTHGLDCFAGHTTWEPPCLRWSHDIDLAAGPAAAVDIGRVEWDGDDLIETGLFVIDGSDVPYVEVWRKHPVSDERVVEITDVGYTRIEIGEHALTVNDQRAGGGRIGARYERDGRVHLAIGDDRAAHPVGARP